MHANGKAILAGHVSSNREKQNILAPVGLFVGEMVGLAVGCAVGFIT